MATENPSWGYLRITGALANLGHIVARTTVANVLDRHGLSPAPDRKTTWRQFLSAHGDVLAATDFLTVEVWRPFGLVRYHVMFIIALATRRVHIAGIIAGPHGTWMHQVARNLTDAFDGFLLGKRYLIMDRDPLFTRAFRETLKTAGVKPVRLPARSPNLNAFAERFVLSIKSECLDRMILFSEAQIRRAVLEYVTHYHEERPHQGLENRLITASTTAANTDGEVQRRARLGGLLSYYHREAA
jgi:transposase InsO family protein